MAERIIRVNELIKEEVSKLIPNEVSDPAAGMITVTDVKTSADLHYATIWVSIMSENPIMSLALIEEAQPRMQKILNERLRMKYVPKISFKIDHGTKHAEKIERLLAHVYKKKEPAKKILLIEDDPFLQSAYDTQLGFANFDVIVAETAKEALEKLEDEENLDLIILDLKLPDMNGAELMRKFREKNPEFDIPIIVLTNYTKQEASKMTQDLNPVYCWTKTESPLVETVEIIKEFLKKKAE